MQILYRIEAAEDVRKARRWYEAQRKGLGRAFHQDLRRVESLLRRHPAAFPFVRGAYRRMVLQQFPYAVYYELLEVGDLEVVAVLHQRRQESEVLDGRG